MIEEVVVSWQEVRWLWWIRQNFIAQLVQLLKHWLCDVQSGVVMEKNWAHTVDQCWLQALQFFVQLINLFSILLRCNGFNQDSESSSGSDGQQTTKQWPWPLFGESLALGSALEALLSPITELVIADCHMQSTFHCTSQSNLELVCCFSTE